MSSVEHATPDVDDPIRALPLAPPHVYYALKCEGALGGGELHGTVYLDEKTARYALSYLQESGFVAIDRQIR